MNSPTSRTTAPSRKSSLSAQGLPKGTQRSLGTTAMPVGTDGVLQKHHNAEHHAAKNHLEICGRARKGVPDSSLHEASELFNV